MSYNGSGTFTRKTLNNTGTTCWNADRIAGIKATSQAQDYHDQDIADGLSNCICKDGQSTPTANIPMGGYKLINMAAGSSAGDSVRYGQAILASGANAFTADQSMGLHKLTSLMESTTAADAATVNQAEHIIAHYLADSDSANTPFTTSTLTPFVTNLPASVFWNNINQVVCPKSLTITRVALLGQASGTVSGAGFFVWIYKNGVDTGAISNPMFTLNSATGNTAFASVSIAFAAGEKIGVVFGTNGTSTGGTLSSITLWGY